MAVYPKVTVVQAVRSMRPEGIAVSGFATHEWLLELACGHQLRWSANGVPPTEAACDLCSTRARDWLDSMGPEPPPPPPRLTGPDGVDVPF